MRVLQTAPAGDCRSRHGVLKKFEMVPIGAFVIVQSYYTKYDCWLNECFALSADVFICFTGCLISIPEITCLEVGKI
jgi:hypothetical protein